MRILALDLGTHTGWADGHAGSVPLSGVIRIAAKKDKVSGRDMKAVFYDQGSNLQIWLRDRWRSKIDRPDMVVIESVLPPHPRVQKSDDPDVPDKTIDSGWWSTVMAWGQAQHASTTARVYGIEFQEVHSLSATKHFLGVGRFKPMEINGKLRTGREIRKIEVKKRCWQLNYLKEFSGNDNQADALCVWDWAQSTFSRRVPRFQLTATR